MKDFVKSWKMDFQAYRVEVRIESNDPELLENVRRELPKAVPNDVTYDRNDTAGHIFKLLREESTGLIAVSKEAGEPVRFSDEERLIEYLLSQIRITIAEFAHSRVFIHAGAVGWKNSAIIIPGKSHSGKTTLVSELIRHGADYYSDEYAVLDESGNLRPYPKWLSVRGIIDEYRQTETPPDEFGAKIGEKAIPVGLILFTEFEKGAPWDPQCLRPGEGVMEILQHTIPIRFKPGFVLNVLKKTVSRAIIAKSKRGEAEISIPSILEFFETVCH